MLVLWFGFKLKVLLCYLKSVNLCFICSKPVQIVIFFRHEIAIELFQALQKIVEKMEKRIFYYCQAAAFAPLHFKPTIEIN